MMPRPSLIAYAITPTGIRVWSARGGVREYAAPHESFRLDATGFSFESEGEVVSLGCGVSLAMGAVAEAAKVAECRRLAELKAPGIAAISEKRRVASHVAVRTKKAQTLTRVLEVMDLLEREPQRIADACDRVGVSHSSFQKLCQKLPDLRRRRLAFGKRFASAAG